MAESDPALPPQAGLEAFTCDFCGRKVQRVRRVALDRDYDRLGVKHVRQYACEPCSVDKDNLRARVDAVAPTSR